MSIDFLQWLFGVLLLLVTETSLAAPIGSPSGYFEDKERGWFWKEPVLLVEEPEQDSEEAPVASVAPPSAKTPAEPVASNSPVPIEAPAPFTPAWLREKLPEYRDRAIGDPTSENVRAYFYLQRYAMDMAERFATAAQRVVLSDAVLDENQRRPLSTYGARVVDELAKEQTLELAKTIAAQAGIWYFYRSDCPYCKAQNPVLKRLKRRLGLTILPIALDGRHGPDSAYPNTVLNRGQAELLGVTSTPTLYMVKRPNEFVLLSEGLVADTGFIQRMIHAAVEAGWITDQEFNRSRAIRPTQLWVESEDALDDVIRDPQRLVDYLRTQLIHEPM